MWQLLQAQAEKHHIEKLKLFHKSLYKLFNIYLKETKRKYKQKYKITHVVNKK